jgi:2-methylisocitrate lyase-like PEP mutase family enzyme
MSALQTAADQPTLAGLPTAHDPARALLGQVMGFVAVTVGFTARSRVQFGASSAYRGACFAAIIDRRNAT